jgi:hypothetical protein
MPIELDCPGCGKRLRVADEHAGRAGRCPGCQTVFNVPRASMPAQANPPGQPSSFAGEWHAAPAKNEAGPASGTGEMWYMCTPEGGEFGPVPMSTLNRWIAERRLSGDCRLLPAGTQQWVWAADVFPQLAAAAPQGSVAVPSPPPAKNPFADQDKNPYASPRVSHPLGVSTPQYYQPHRGGLVLTIAVLGWVICYFFGVAAWIMGASDIAAMRRGQMDPSGMGMTQAGMIIGMVQTILGLIAFVLIFVLALLDA